MLILCFSFCGPCFVRPSGRDLLYRSCPSEQNYSQESQNVPKSYLPFAHSPCCPRTSAIWWRGWKRWSVNLMKRIEVILHWRRWKYVMDMVIYSKDLLIKWRWNTWWIGWWEWSVNLRRRVVELICIKSDLKDVDKSLTYILSTVL